jgi:hypothetical protein
MALYTFREVICTSDETKYAKISISDEAKHIGTLEKNKN